jgi:hypothetical protein
LLLLTTGANATILASNPASGTFRVGFQFYGYVENGATAGNVVMQIAQNASSATATQYLAGSFLEYMEIA